jgi:hypothetical protein
MLGADCLDEHIESQRQLENRCHAARPPLLEISKPLKTRWHANFEQRAGFEPAIHGYCVAQAISSSGDKELAVKNLIDLASADWATPTRVLGVGLEPTLYDRDLGRK